MKTVKIKFLKKLKKGQTAKSKNTRLNVEKTKIKILKVNKIILN